jgi:cyclophilin family peptidyl-prolyl cis-trans isomerase
VLARIKADFPDDVHFVYRHFPLDSIHDKALLATQASEAAGLQGKFWGMHDFLFANFNLWAGLPAEQFPGWLVENATDMGLDMGQFEADLTSEPIVAIAQEAWENGRAIGVPGTPYVAINNIPYPSNTAMDYGSFVRIINANKLTERQYTECPPMVIDPLKQYIATIETKKGDIVLELFPDVAPMTVNSFVFLARDGWFDGVTFHRVLPDFMAQGGDPSGSGLGGPGYAFKNETSPDLSFDREGLLAMANSGPDTNGSQFFITYGVATHLDGGYTIFGEVLEGMDVVQSLTPRDPSQGGDLPPGDVIITITIEEK